MSNYIRLALYIVGLFGVAYVAWSMTSDVVFSGAIVLVAHWIKPFKV